MSEMIVRPADPERDAAACAAIYAPNVEGSPVSFEERPPDAAELARRIASTSRTHPWLVAEQDGEVVGYAYACPHRSRPAYRWAVEVSVYVSSSHRGRGCGRRLYRELFARLRQQGFTAAFAGITLPNEASIRLHESLDFRPIGVFQAVGWKQGRWCDVGWWQLQLAPAGEGPPPEPAPPG